jgi:aminoglycoside/choline kinase family phosphotransferase
MSRDALIAGFLASHGYGAARAEPLAQDASFRRYLRLSGGPRPTVLMDAPPPEDIRPFVRIAEHLAAIGMSVPEIMAADEAQGLLLEEDLGDDLFSTSMMMFMNKAGEEKDTTPSPLVCCGDGMEEAGWGATVPNLAPTAPPNSLSQGEGEIRVNLLFDAAVDALVAMQRPLAPPGLPVWDAATMASTALATLFDWWWPAMFGSDAPDAARQDFASALDTMLAPIAAVPTCFVHRDFFAGNLIWLPRRAGIRRVGVLDFQGAALGHPAYDLASLLQDARRDIPPTVADRAITRYLAARPELNPAEFRAAYAACAVQRHLRVAAQWVRLALRDNRPAYLVHGARTWRLLEVALREPIAAPLAAALDRWIPAARRANPAGLGP